MTGIRHLILRNTPPRILNNLLLEFSFLYRIKLINYESALQENNGIEELLTKLVTILNENVEGDIIECGSARCGTTVIIANYLRSRGINNKKIYALDLFGGGFDLNELEEERRVGLTNAKDDAFTHTSYDYIKKKIDRLGLTDIIFPVKGLFVDTLPHIDSKVCFALIDCDLKKSTLYSAETLWPKLSKNGIMLFDDYYCDAFKGSKIAVDEFVNKHSKEISKHGFLNRLYYIQK